MTCLLGNRLDRRWGKHTPKHRFKTNNPSAKQTLN